ncbi:MAG: SPFH domain-containing protein [Candidatus Latescibacterota bacterium]|nr:MAG: SPFH domain-containing protein [Candidatus Latescibacterota bacterium]
MQTVTERRAWRMSGFLGLFLFLAFIAVDIYVLRAGILADNVNVLWFFVPFTLFSVIFATGLTVVQPNEARVLVLFGSYTGSIRESGFYWVNPLASKRHISLRIRNFNSEKIKVNDSQGNPIEIGAVIVWHIVDTARALFDVENYAQFVDIQSETAIRALASEYPYDTQREDETSLRGSQAEIADMLKRAVQTRLEIAGVTVLESRISHLAYSPEIAQAMLRRQQAQAIIAARQKIVEGAVGMVEMALRELSEQKIIELDQDKRATMVNNLMVALVSDREVSPVINTGTLYQ